MLATAGQKKISIKLKAPPKIKVTYIYLAKGGFLYDKEKQDLYSLEAPHRFIGKLAEMVTEEDE